MKFSVATTPICASATALLWLVFLGWFMVVSAAQENTGETSCWCALGGCDQTNCDEYASCGGGGCIQDGLDHPSCGGGNCSQQKAAFPSCGGGGCDQTGASFPLCGGGRCCQKDGEGGICWNCEENSHCSSDSKSNSNSNPDVEAAQTVLVGDDGNELPPECICLQGGCYQQNCPRGVICTGGHCDQRGLESPTCVGGNCNQAGATDPFCIGGRCCQDSPTTTSCAPQNCDNACEADALNTGFWLIRLPECDCFMGGCDQRNCGAHSSCSGGRCDQSTLESPSCLGGNCNQEGANNPSCLVGGCCQRDVTGGWPSCLPGNCNDDACATSDGSVSKSSNEVATEAESSSASLLPSTSASGTAFAVVVVALVATLL